MKLTIGGSKGKPIPRIFNPAVFLGAALVATLAAVFAALLALLFIVTVPFSFVMLVRVNE